MAVRGMSLSQWLSNHRRIATPLALPTAVELGRTKGGHLLWFRIAEP